MLASWTRPVAAHDPISFYAQAARAEDRVLWLRPASGEALVGSGAARIFIGTGNERFQQVAAAWRQLTADALVHDLVGSSLGGPLLLGGFSFDPLRRGSSVWAGFPDARLVLPEQMLVLRDGAAWLTTNVVVDPDEPPPTPPTPPASAQSGSLDEPMTPGAWQTLVGSVARGIRSGDLGLEKVVLARSRQVQQDAPIDAIGALRHLADAYPSCTIFAVDHAGATSPDHLGVTSPGHPPAPAHSEATFLGATPERLIVLRGGTASTMALAGSMPRGATPAEDDKLADQLLRDPKERAEHAVVVAALREGLCDVCTRLIADAQPIKLWVHLDERSAAYFGLGLARALRAPVGLLATSGTAAANFLPAVVEAFLARVPLVVLTADRPHELRDMGAPQTINQLRLYGEHVKWFFDLPEPELLPEQVRLVRTLAARAVATAAADPPGPVHLNWPFREPLVPQTGALAAAWGARSQGTPYVDVHAGRLAPSTDLVGWLAAELAELPRGVIVCGPDDDPDLPHAVVRLAKGLGYPVLADPLSRVRWGGHDRSLVVDAYDAFLRHAPTVEHLAPQVVLRLGALPTSKPLVQYLESAASSGARHILVDAGGWREPTGLASDVLHVDAGLLCAALSDALPASAQRVESTRCTPCCRAAS